MVLDHIAQSVSIVVGINEALYEGAGRLCHHSQKRLGAVQEQSTNRDGFACAKHVTRKRQEAMVMDTGIHENPLYSLKIGVEDAVSHENR
jgi:hypothetical protein